MPQKKKRLTQREKDRRAAIKKQLQEEGFLPPNKPRLNRKKFAREVWDEFNAMDTFTGTSIFAERSRPPWGRICTR